MSFPNPDLYPSPDWLPSGASGRRPATTPHLAVPFHRGADGQVATVEQDSDQHILGQQQVVVQCPLGFRAERPDFGWPFPYGRNVPIDPAPLQDALDRLVGRGTITAEQWLDQADPSIQHIRVSTQVNANG